jgi:4-amino-4-deoxy-L-arabinose transferase-like glycosyltransferase
VNTSKPASPKPALVTQRGARRLPRIPLLLLCAAYVIPGLLGRDPWRNADLTAFGQMAALAEGRTPWLTPMLGGVQADMALLPHWLGAAFIFATSGFLEPAVAARVPFALLLALTLALVWYTAFHLARTEAAQPVPFAFGGEASPVDYARAVADGALLALMASLGLLLLGHETTPELAQLCALSLYSYALAAAPYRHAPARWAVLAALPLLTGSGAPAMSLAVGVLGALVCWRSRFEQVRAFSGWIAASAAVAVVLGYTLGAWHWRGESLSFESVADLLRQWLWFMWPVWPLALWTLWRWRKHLTHRHLAVPLVSVTVSLAANIVMGGNDRALMLGLPALAVLAAFALPTLQRSAAAAIDWFSMSFFTLFALWIWFVYAALQTGMPAWQAANVARLLPGFRSHFGPLPLLLAALGTTAWVWLVRWRTGRHREALWKSLVLPAGGVALCWLLLMTLWLEPLNYARSPRPLVDRLATLLPPTACVAAPGMAPAGVSALEVFGRWKVDAKLTAADGECDYLVWSGRSRRPPAPPGWNLVGEVRRPTDQEELTLVYRRTQR